MAAEQILLILIPAAYFIGAIPFGLIVGKMRGIDVRTAGSGNIGATNVGRLLGKKFFFLVFFLDMLKSFVPMLVASIIVHRTPLGERDRAMYLLWLLVGFVAVLGHMFSIFLRFKGGKGVATSAGMMLGLVPYYTYPGLIGIGIFLVAVMLTRYISVGSLAGAASFPMLYALMCYLRGWPMLREQLPLLIFAMIMALLIIWKHRGNIARLMAGTENRLGSRGA